MDILNSRDNEEITLLHHLHTIRSQRPFFVCNIKIYSI